MTADIEAPEGVQISRETHWHLEVLAPEWVWSIKRMVNRLPEETRNIPDFAYQAFDGEKLHFFFNKSAVTADMLAFVTGLSVETITSHPGLRLRELAVDPKLPKPSVAYTGEA